MVRTSESKTVIRYTLSAIEVRAAILAYATDRDCTDGNRAVPTEDATVSFVDGGAVIESVYLKKGG